MTVRVKWVLLCAVGLAALATARSESSKPESPTQRTTKELIEQLGSDEFPIREAATMSCSNALTRSRCWKLPHHAPRMPRSGEGPHESSGVSAASPLAIGWTG
jgi:hypothetical protein